MSARIVSVEYEATVAEAARVMQAAGVGSCVVIRARSMAGIFTERDLVTAAAAGVDASRSLVRAWMTTDVLTMPSATLLTEALETLKTRRHRRLPVVDDGELVGMISLSDFVRDGSLFSNA